MTKLCICKRRGHDKPVLNGLALTPSQVAMYTAQGRPVSVKTLSDDQYVEGVSNPSFDDIPISERRGFDIAQVWEQLHDVRSNYRNLVSSNKLNQSN